MKYLGNIITRTPTTPTTSAAKGIWHLEDAAYYRSIGSWPVPLDPVITAESYTTDPTNATSYTFSNQSVGTATSDRWVVAGALFDDNTGTLTTITALSYNSVYQTFYAPAGNTQSPIGFYFLKDTTSSTATNAITVNAGTSTHGSHAFFSVKGISNLSYSNFYSQSNNTNSYNISITVPNNGIVIALANFNAAGTTTWSSNVTEKFNVASTDGDIWGGAVGFFQTASTPSITVTAPAGVARSSISILVLQAS